MGKISSGIWNSVGSKRFPIRNFLLLFRQFFINPWFYFAFKSRPSLYLGRGANYGCSGGNTFFVSAQSQAKSMRNLFVNYEMHAARYN